MIHSDSTGSLKSLHYTIPSPSVKTGGAGGHSGISDLVSLSLAAPLKSCTQKILKGIRSVDIQKLPEMALTEAYAVPLGLVGAVGGMLAGMVYAGSIIFPIMNGSDKAYYRRMSTGKSILKEFLAPITIAAKGWRKFHGDAAGAMKETIDDVKDDSGRIMDSMAEKIEETLINDKAVSPRGCVKEAVSETCGTFWGLLGLTLGVTAGSLYSVSTIIPLMVTEDNYYSRQPFFQRYLHQTHAPVTLGFNWARKMHQGGKEAMNEVINETGQNLGTWGSDLAGSGKYIFGKGASRGIGSRIGRAIVETIAIPIGLAGAVGGAALGVLYSGSVLFPCMIGRDNSYYNSKSEAGSIIKEFLAPISWISRGGYAFYNGTRDMLGVNSYY